MATVYHDGLEHEVSQYYFQGVHTFCREDVMVVPTDYVGLMQPRQFVRHDVLVSCMRCLAAVRRP